MKSDEDDEISCSNRFVPHQIRDNERIFQNIFRILTQFPPLNLIIFHRLDSPDIAFQPPQCRRHHPFLCYQNHIVFKFKHHHDMFDRERVLVIEFKIFGNFILVVENFTWIKFKMISWIFRVAWPSVEFGICTRNFSCLKFSKFSSSPGLKYSVISIFACAKKKGWGWGDNDKTQKSQPT